MKKTIIQKFNNVTKYLKKERKKNVYKPRYKLVNLNEENGLYTVVIKLINRNIVFDTTPEEILANDYLVDQFSPRDIRTLTYLGYLGINSPKYKILAKKLSENEEVKFLLQKRGEKTIIVKTAEEINQETSIILNMDANDAKTVGYIMGSESVAEEKRQKEQLIQQLKNDLG